MKTEAMPMQWIKQAISPLLTQSIQPWSLLSLLALAAGSAGAATQTICTVVADAKTGQVLVQEGECSGRYTPASTFKIALSLMGFDAGILQDEATPKWPFKPGYTDFGGAAWREPTDPARWMQYSVVWFSQQIASQLGPARLAQYTRDFDYGNADVTGWPSPDNHIDGAWIMSTLRISPLEQVQFVRKIVNRQLPIKAQAYAMTERITRMDSGTPGLTVHGKTGTGSPGSDGRYDAAQAYGWFVGWAQQGSQTVVFARLIQDDQATIPSAGVRARQSLLQDLPALMRQ